MKKINVEGFDAIFVTGLMEEMERIAPVLKSIGFTQIKDRPNAYQFETGINAPLGNAFDADPKITFRGMPISEETAKKISAALIEEVLKIIGPIKKQYEAIGAFTRTEGRGTTEMIEGVWDSLQKSHDGYEILSKYLEDEQLKEPGRWFDIEKNDSSFFATTGTDDLDFYIAVKAI